MPSDTPLLTTNQVADLLQVHPKHIYRLLKRGLPARKVGGEWRFLRDEILEWTRSASGARGHAALRTSTGPRGDEAGSRPPVLAANGDLAVEALLRLAASEHDTHLGLLRSDRAGAYEHLRSGRALAGGHHGPLPAWGGELGPEDLVLVRLVEREVGLVARTTWRLPPLEDIPTVRFATRPATAGVRLLLDEALGACGVDPIQAQQEAAVLDSHRDVVLAVTSGKVQTGISTRAWAQRAELAFTPLATEQYGVLLRRSDLDDPRIQALLTVTRSPRFRSTVEALGGYDPKGAGEVVALPEATC